MTTNIKFTNFASTTLASSITSGDLSADLAVGTGSSFPTLTGSNYFYGVFIDAATGNTKEIVKVTARSSDTITIVRAQDGTTASAFLAGDRFELRLVAASEQTAVRTDEVILTANKTLSVSNTLTLAGTDGTTMTFPGTSATVARTDAANTFTGDQSFAGDIILTGAGKGVIFEGTTADAHESTLLAGEPTADRTITLPDETCTLGFRNIPQNIQTDNYTLVLADSGKHVYETGASKTITIPANASVAYPIGTAVTFVAGANSVSIAITSDTMYLASSGGTGTRSLAARGVATAIKVDTTVWHISGAGLT